jgi:preprotein translocase subunit SecG
MQLVVSIIHVVACLTLIAVILLQAGRGGGLSDMFGGGVQQSQKVFGTETNQVMVKATSVCAILFLVTSMVLGFIISRKNRSLMLDSQIKPVFSDTELPSDLIPEDLKESSATEVVEEAVQATDVLVPGEKTD